MKFKDFLNIFMGLTDFNMELYPFLQNGFFEVFTGLGGILGGTSGEVWENFGGKMGLGKILGEYI